jgi:hypothetical protein
MKSPYETYPVAGGWHAADHAMRITCYGKTEAEAVMKLRSSQERRRALLQMAAAEDAGARSRERA